MVWPWEEADIWSLLEKSRQVVNWALLNNLWGGYLRLENLGDREKGCEGPLAGTGSNQLGAKRKSK